MYAEPSPMALLRWGSDDQTSDDGEAMFCADLNGTSRKESDCENTLRCFTEWFAGGERSRMLKRKEEVLGKFHSRVMDLRKAACTSVPR